MTPPMMTSSTYAESAIASDVVHMLWTAGMAPACGDDSSVSPARVSSGRSASLASAANHEVIALLISQLTSRNPQLLLPAAAGAGDGLGLAAGEGGDDGCAASRTGAGNAARAAAGRAGARAGEAARGSAAQAASMPAARTPASTRRPGRAARRGRAGRLIRRPGTSGR